MIVAGEASGDMHGARLVQAMLESEPGLSFFGMGGPAMAGAGVELLYDAARLAVVGITEVLAHLGDILAARRRLIRRMRTTRPALLILIDFPDFNLHLAAKAKQLGIPVFYYISPQVWAWRSGRVRKIGRLADRIGVILPFEQRFYAERGVTVDFVGHPLVDTVEARLGREEFFRRHNLDQPEDRPVIGLLPGSRTREIQALLPVFLAGAGLLQDNLSRRPVFLLAVAPTISREQLHDHGLETWQNRLDLHVIDQDRYDLMAACDCVAAASGTVTLELAILGIPMLTAYRLSPRTYLLGRLLIRSIRYFSLVNLIADREVIPELLQDQVTPEAVARLLAELLGRAGRRQADDLGEVRRRLGPAGAAHRAARIALQTMHEGAKTI